MKKILMTMMLVIAVVTASAQTKRQLFDFGWQFTHNGQTQTVDLPHDWDIFEGPNSGKGATGTGGGWFEAGKGEYRKTFKTPNGEIVKLHFEGVYQKAEVYVNGQRAGQHHYGYTPFTVDVTPYINKDKKQVNEVIVKVENSEQPNCRWYSGSGIYRHVWLETMPALHIAENGVFVTTPEVSADKARVQVDVTVQNESQTDRNAIVVVGGAQLMVAVKAGESKTVTTTVFVKNPRLWSPENPTLYEAKVELKEAGNVIDNATAKYGIRTFSFDAENGFVLNGKKVLINGACVHHDDGVLGAMAFDDAEIRKVRQMRRRASTSSALHTIPRRGLSSMPATRWECLSLTRPSTVGARRRIPTTTPPSSTPASDRTSMQWCCATATIRALSHGASATRSSSARTSAWSILPVR